MSRDAKFPLLHLGRGIVRSHSEDDARFDVHPQPEPTDAPVVPPPAVTGIGLIARPPRAMILPPGAQFEQTTHLPRWEAIALQHEWHLLHDADLAALRKLSGLRPSPAEGFADEYLADRFHLEPWQRVVLRRFEAVQ
jgi:hypothetical protein